MSDTIRKLHEIQEDNDQKLMDIDQALKEYEGNVIDKWEVINKITAIMSH